MSIDIVRLKQLLSRFGEHRVLVVGDVMLDHYIQGSVHRISPEAPVPVVQVTSERYVPGGSSNVSANIASMGGQVSLAGAFGADDQGRILKNLLAKKGVQTSPSLSLRGFRTTVKMRILAERQQVVRVDREDKFVYTAATLQQFKTKIEKELARCSGVILEDYAKGVLQQPVVDLVLLAARKRGIPVGLDPKPGDERQLQLAGITFATPNRREAFLAAEEPETAPAENPLQDKPLLRIGAKLMKKWRPGFLLVTLGSRGILLLSRDAPPKHVPTRAREVFDVSGAGDTVIATCTLALAAGATCAEAAEIANYAAGVVVGKLGTATCTPQELLEYIKKG